MNDSGAGDLRIPLSMDVDASSIQGAIEQAEHFEGTVDGLRAELERLQAQAVKTFNAMAFPGQKGAGFPTYQAMQQSVGAQGAAAFPQVQALTQRIAQLERQIAAGGTTAASSPAPSLAERVEQSVQRTRPGRQSPSFGDQLAQRVFSTRSLGVLGAFSQGDFAAGGKSLARSFLEAVAMGAGRQSMGQAAAVALSGSTSAGGAADAGAVDAGAAVEGAAGAGLASRVGSALLSPAGIIAGVLATIGAVGLGVNKVQAQLLGQQATLQANVGGAQPDALSGVLHQGQAFNVTPALALDVANTLGRAGVTGNDIVMGTGTTLGFAGANGLDPKQITQLTASMMVQGRASSQMVATFFQELKKGADGSGQSLTHLIDSLVALQNAGGGAGLSARGMMGLVAAGALLGPGANAGTLYGPTTGAIGVDKFKFASLLGMTQDQFAAAQNDPAIMQDSIARFTRTVAHGQTDPATIARVESYIQSTGLMSFAGMSRAKTDSVVRGLITQSPTAAEDARNALLRTSHLKSEEAFLSAEAQLTSLFTPAITRAGLAATYAADQFLLAGLNMQGFNHPAAGVMPGGTIIHRPDPRIPGSTVTVVPPTTLPSPTTPSGATTVGILPPSLPPPAISTTSPFQPSHTESSHTIHVTVVTHDEKGNYLGTHTFSPTVPRVDPHRTPVAHKSHAPLPRPVIVPPSGAGGPRSR